jgi:hypothetical protein
MLSMGHFGPPALSDENSSLILRERDVTLSMMMMNEHSSSERHGRGRRLSSLSDETSSLRFPDDEKSSLRLGASNNTRGITIAQSKGPT